LAALAFADQTSSAPGDRAQDIAHRLEQARALQAKGSSREARKLYESLVPILEAEKRQAELADALIALAELASGQGEYDVAIARARQAAAIYRILGNKPGEARALNSWGVNESYRGDYPAALAQLEQALALNLSAGNREGEIEQLSNLGGVFQYQGKYMDAWRAYRAALDKVDQVPSESWSPRRRQLAVHNLATLLQRLGRYEQALELYQQLRAAPRALSSSEEARLLVNVGVLYRRLGDPIKALDTYRTAQQLFARDQHVHGQIGALRNIGIVLALDLGDLSAALEAFNRALELAEQSHDRLQETHAHLYRGETLLRLNQPDAARQDFESALATAKERRTPEEQWKALFGLGRTATLAGKGDLARASLQQAIAIIEEARSALQLSSLRAEFLGDKRDVYDALIELSLDKPDAAGLFRLMEGSRARMFQDQLEQSARRGRPPLGTAVGLSQVQAHLDASTALLEFWVSSTKIAVAWVTRDGFGIAPKELGSGGFQRISSFLQEIAAGAGDSWQEDSRALGQLLLSGVEPLGRGSIRHLLLVPDGVLQSIPFEALRAGTAASPLLVERFDISYLPSASALLRESSAARPSWHFPWQRQLLALGDPIVRSQTAPAPAELLTADESRARLPKSAEEVEAIARLSRGRAEVYLGAADLKRHLLEGKAKGVSLLHLSTHATADDDNPERSRILFSPAEADQPADYLFLKEIYGLDLQGVDLTTLSACDTERGKLIKGEGVQGFSRALLSAGSRATVTSLWRVADQPTAELMKQFYYGLSRGIPKAEALRLAKLKFLHSDGALQHPRHWAAFILHGDGLQPVPRVISWGALLIPLAAALFVFGVAATRRKKGAGLRPPPRSGGQPG